jgi:hypothetical protein
VAGAVKPVKPVKHEDNKTIVPNHLRPAPLDGFIEFEGRMRVESLAQVIEPARLAVIAMETKLTAVQIGRQMPIFRVKTT